MNRLTILLAGIAVLALAACSGAGNSGGAVPPTGGGSPTGHGTANATLTITIPRGTGTSSSARGTQSVRPSYISTNTNSMSIAINGGTAQDFGLTNTSPGCSGTGSSTKCTITIAAPVGTNESWAFALYSTTNETGTPLSLDTQTGITITAGVANTLGPYTLNPVVGSYTLAFAAPLTLTAGSNGGATVNLVVKDPSDATIIMPGSYVDSTGAADTFTLTTDIGRNGAPWTTTSQSYALSPTSIGSPSGTASPSNTSALSYGGLSMYASTITIHDSSNVQAAGATLAVPAVLGAPLATNTCNHSGDTCGNGSTSSHGSISFVAASDTATVVTSEPGWTPAPYGRTFSVLSNNCAAGTATLSATSGTNTYTVTAGSTAGGPCQIVFQDSGVLGQSITVDVTLTTSTVTVQSKHRSQ